jgi:hypothetical protein
MGIHLAKRHRRAAGDSRQAPGAAVAPAGRDSRIVE